MGYIYIYKLYELLCGYTILCFESVDVCLCSMMILWGYKPIESSIDLSEML